MESFERESVESRSFSSSPVVSGQQMNPLSIRVNASPIPKDTQECQTPVKRVDDGGLLTYSTPTPLNAAYIGYHLLRKLQMSAVQQQQQVLKTATKPRANFHSIDDLASSSSSSGSPSDSDSGYSTRLYDHEQSTAKKLDMSDAEEPLPVPQSADNQANSKKVRTTFTDGQKKALDVYFQRNPYPDPRETEELSQQLVLPENVIKVWFQNKRSRDKQRKFSHKTRHATSGSESSSLNTSPLVANLQMLTYKLNSYAALANNPLVNHHY